MYKGQFKIVNDFEDELRSLRDHLAAGHERLVLVESCTAGITSGLLGQIPGISQYLCGSLVVYRNDSKYRWLGIEPSLLEESGVGPVSRVVTQQLAMAALVRTPEATLAASITGHLGPDAPAELDGRVFTCVLSRLFPDAIRSVEHSLVALSPRDTHDWQARQLRQLEAARILINELVALLTSNIQKS